MRNISLTFSRFTLSSSIDVSSIASPLSSKITERHTGQSCSVSGFRMHLLYLSLLIYFGTTWVVIAASNNGICYDTDEVQISNSACDPEAEVSVCCGFGFTCLSNGLCETYNKTTSWTGFWTGGCTDVTWTSSACPKICNNDKNRQANFHSVVLPFIADHSMWYRSKATLILNPILVCRTSNTSPS